jgi:hypothetical protein
MSSIQLVEIISLFNDLDTCAISAYFSTFMNSIFNLCLLFINITFFLIILNKSF